jgi:MerR family transcriptional regulator, light-induced transcriptional regulator
MITDPLYRQYLHLLLQGNRNGCARIVQQLLDQNIDIKALYTELFQKSLYRVGELWESNQISVAREHLVTAITEGLLNLVYPRLFEKERATPKKVIISCAANEFHQIGGKMAADIFELNGWDSHFLGANTPVEHMLEYIQEEKPDLVGLSVSVYCNMPALKAGLEAIKSDFKDLDVFVGGQAFNWGGRDLVKQSGARYIPSLDVLDTIITE